MPITMGSNIASLQARRVLDSTTKAVGKVQERLASGMRINRASDDAAGLAIAETLKADSKVFAQAIRNVNDGVSALNIAESAIAELSGIVNRIRELATQSANGALSNTQRESLDKEDLSQVFDDFVRISCPETRYVTGTGLGLSIVKKIVESHFGRIEVRSKLNEGTTFTIKFPLKENKPCV